MWKRWFRAPDDSSSTRQLLEEQQPIPESSDEEALADYVDTKIIYQAGVDFESKPMVVICACNLPDPSKVDYDKILSRILRKLDLFVESDYTVVLFVGGAQYRPSWTWLFKAYKSLSRNYKKNLKNLYIVHTTPWARILLDVINLFISPKFGRKIKYVPSLSKLAKHIPITQIEIPPLVYKYNLMFEDKITLQERIHDGDNGPHMFGVPIEVLMGSEGEKGLPKVIKDCVNFLRQEGLETEGIFRRSPNSVSLRQAKEAYDRGNPINLADYGVHVAAVLLKMFFHDLPVPVFPAQLYETLRQIQSKSGHVERIEFIRDTVFPLLSPPIVLLLQYVCSLFHDISKNQDINKMTPYNLAVIMSLNLVRSRIPLEDVSMCLLSMDSDSGGGVGLFMKTAIEHFELLFDGIEEPKDRIRDAIDSGIASISSSLNEFIEIPSSSNHNTSAPSSIINPASPPKYPSIRKMRSLASLRSPSNSHASLRVGAGVEISGLMVNGTVSRSPPSTPFGEEPELPTSLASIDELRRQMSH